MNVWFWPFATGPAEYYWAPGTGLAETLRRYLAFYVLTSLVWDAFGALGNTLLLLAFGAPILRALRRFRDRLEFVYQPQGSGP
jgi:energy-coupling factor transport system substrate-specific component